jgi:uncharacterized membrane protein
MMAKRLGFGGIVFLVGLVLAILIALFNATFVPAWAVVLLAVMGIVVGLLNVQEHEVQQFLVASITFLISFQALSAIFTTLALGWAAIGTFFMLMNVFVAPAAAIVAVKAIFSLARH